MVVQKKSARPPGFHPAARVLIDAIVSTHPGQVRTRHPAGKP
jgi:hypothetical protein